MTNYRSKIQLVAGLLFFSLQLFASVTIDSTNLVNPSCEISNGSIRIFASTDATTLEYSIDNQLFQTSNLFENLSEGSYTIYVRDDLNFTDQLIVMLEPISQSGFKNINIQNNLCDLSNDGIISWTPSGLDMYQYSINNGVYQNDTLLDELAPGDYEIRLIDGKQCVKDSIVTILNGMNPTANFNTVLNELTLELVNASVNATNFEWYIDPVNYYSEIQNPEIIQLNKVGDYVVTLISKENECKDTIKKVISLQSNLEIEIPNIFSPNNDGQNDVFKVFSNGLNELNVWIYNRWGGRVYHWKGIEGTWDGTSWPTGLECKEGTYFYRAETIDVEGKEKNFDGIITLVR